MASHIEPPLPQLNTRPPRVKTPLRSRPASPIAESVAGLAISASSAERASRRVSRTTGFIPLLPSSGSRTSGLNRLACLGIGDGLDRPGHPALRAQRTGDRLVQFFHRAQPQRDRMARLDV